MASGLNTDHLKKCLGSLAYAWQKLNTTHQDHIEYDVYRNAVVKGFELTLETAGKLLRKAIKVYLSNPKQANTLTYKDLFREAAKVDLLKPAIVERWFAYRDSRNDTAHDYGVDLAEHALTLVPQFLEDAENLQKILDEPRFKTEL